MCYSKNILPYISYTVGFGGGILGPLSAPPANNISLLYEKLL